MALSPEQHLPVAVIGAGPVGLAAAAHLLERDLTPLVFEAGPDAASAMRDWGHVRLFTPWEFAIDAAAQRLLEQGDWTAPEGDGYPTAAEFVDAYLQPLADRPEIAARLRVGHRVRAITKLGIDKLKDAGRETAPFELIVDTPDGEQRVLARAVIDASGTWQTPNPLGSGGLPATGETEHRDRIAYRIPDPLGDDHDRYADRRVLVVGAGHSALTALVDLAALRRDAPQTTITWVIRRPELGDTLGGGEDDQLRERGALGEHVAQLLADGEIELVTGFHTLSVDADNDGDVRLTGHDRVLAADEVIAATGFRPDLSLLSELRLDLDDRVEAATALAPLIDPNLHSCGDVPPHGVDELSHPDPGVYLVGMKSYGRAPTFLMLTGYEQARSISAALAGDWQSARDVQLVLPETGVCNVNRPADGSAAQSTCCTTTPLSIGVPESASTAGCGCGADETSIRHAEDPATVSA